MKQFARNYQQFSILPQPNAHATAQFQGSSGEIKQSFHGWRDAVNADVVSSISEDRKAAIVYLNRRALTSIDTIRVDRATVREGKTHRHWPREIVEKFLAAEVIRGKQHDSR